MADLDVGNLLGLVIVGGVAMNMVDSSRRRRNNEEEAEPKKKTVKKKRTLGRGINSVMYPRFNSNTPF